MTRDDDLKVLWDKIQKYYREHEDTACGDPYIMLQDSNPTTTDRSPCWRMPNVSAIRRASTSATGCPSSTNRHGQDRPADGEIIDKRCGLKPDKPGRV